MAHVWGIPEGFPDPPDLGSFMPNGRLDYEALATAETQWLDDLAAWCRANTDSRSDLVGEVIRIPWADGYAQYMVYRTNPLQLLHVPLGDAWNVPEYMTKGLTGQDIRDMLERDRKLKELFS